jgi:hypothetical protein
MEWRFSAAKDPNTPVKILESLYEFEDCRLWLSQNPSSPKSLLKKLGEKEAFQHLDPTNWRMAIANVLSNENTSTETIVKIMNWTKGFLDKPLPNERLDWVPPRVESYFEPSIAGNINTPVEILIELEKSTDETTIFYLLKNPKLPRELIAKYVEIVMELTEHEQLHKYSRISENTSLTEDQIVQLSKHPIFYIRDHIARNPRTPVSILMKLQNDEDSQVRYAVIFNPNFPITALQEKLNLRDSDIYEMKFDSPTRFRDAIKLAISRHPNR